MIRYRCRVEGVKEAGEPLRRRLKSPGRTKDNSRISVRWDIGIRKWRVVFGSDRKSLREVVSGNGSKVGR